MATAEPARLVLRDWVVLSETGSHGQIECVAGVGTDGGDFRLLFGPDGAIVLRFSIASMKLVPGLYKVSLQVDDLPPWTFSQTKGDDRVLFMPLPADANGQEILREILDGRELKLRDNLGLTVIRFSLSGSGAALQKMLSCHS